MSSLTAYRRLLGVAGPTYVLIAFLGRLPLAMSQLGTLLLVSQATGSYGAGGAAAGALAVANAVGGPAAGALADRVGQRPVVLVQSLLGGAGLVVLVVLAERGTGGLGLAVAAGATGLLLPQVGPLARVRWRPMTRGAQQQRRLVDAAFSYEGSADEASFVLGPALVGGLVAALDPGAALVLAAVVLVVFGSWFALHPTAALTGRRTTPVVAVAAAAPMGAVLVVLALMQVTVGTVFGSVQTGTSVLATEAGHAGLAGVLHALLGVGSVACGLAAAGLPARIGLERRVQAFAATLLVLSLPLLLVSTLTGAGLSLLVLGCAVGPYMICVFTMAERVTPQHRLGAVMMVLAGATGIGYALGSGLGGRLADLGGPTPAYAVTVGAGVVATVVTLAAGRSLRGAMARSVAHDDPADADRRPALVAG